MNDLKLNAAKKRLIASGCILCAVAGLPLAASAQYLPTQESFNRQYTSEYYFIGQYLHSDDIAFNGPGGDVKLKMDDTGLGGFGLAYHYSDKLTVRADFMFGAADFSGDLPAEGGGTVSVRQNAFVHTGRLNLDYNLLRTRFTPFVTGGIGYQYLQTELTSLPSIPVWDPWEGHYVTGHPVAYLTSLTGNVGAGIRWNINDRLFVKATAGAQWLGYDGAKDVTMQIEGSVAFGWRF